MNLLLVWFDLIGTAGLIVMIFVQWRTNSRLRDENAALIRSTRFLMRDLNPQQRYRNADAQGYASPGVMKGPCFGGAGGTGGSGPVQLIYTEEKK